MKAIRRGKEIEIVCDCGRKEIFVLGRGTINKVLMQNGEDKEDKKEEKVEKKKIIFWWEDE